MYRAMSACACARGRGRLRATRGFSLVEVLVAMLILSIGMLGIGGLFLESVRSSRTALLRTQAISLVGDMADRIRANATARVAYDSGGYAEPQLHDCAPSSTIAGVNCTVQQLAEDDLARWTAAVRGALPGTAATPAGATVTLFPGASASIPDRYQIVVTWNEPGEAQPLVYRSDVVIIKRDPMS